MKKLICVILSMTFLFAVSFSNSIALGKSVTTNVQTSAYATDVNEAAVPAVAAVALGAILVGAFVVGAVDGYNAGGAELELAMNYQDYDSHDFTRFDN